MIDASDDKGDQDVEIHPSDAPDEDTDNFSVFTDSSIDSSDDDQGTDSPSHAGGGTKSVTDSPIAAAERLHVLDDKPRVVSKLGSDPQPIVSPEISVSALFAAADTQQITRGVEVGASGSRPQPRSTPRTSGALRAGTETLHTQVTMEAMMKEMKVIHREIEVTGRELIAMESSLDLLFVSELALPPPRQMQLILKWALPQKK